MTDAVREVCKEVLKRVTPTSQERTRILKLAEKLKQRVAFAAKEMGVDAEVRVEGSIAKDTWLSGEPDIDIFMRVSTTLPREAFGSVCLDIARKATEGARHVERFAEHPYLEAFVNQVRVNIVPCYHVKKGEWRSATDRTPFHTDYIKPLLNKQLCGEVRLLKKFMKGIGVYGAEIKIGGFSGYLSELLVIHYGSFLEVLKTFADWKTRKVIDLEKFYKGREREIKLLFKEPLVIIDPVDKGRNVASAVRKKKLYEFIAASRAFLQNPNLKFFYPPETKAFTPRKLLDTIKLRGSCLVFIKFGEVNVVPDILWGQFYKSQRSLRKMIQRHGFHIIRDCVWSNEKNINMFIFEVEQRCLPPMKKHLGPPIEKQRECESFLQKHRNAPTTISGPYLENGRWIVETRRKHYEIVSLLREKLKNGGRRVGVAEHISQVIPKTLKILVDEEILEIYKSNREFAVFLTKYLKGTPTWL